MDFVSVPLFGAISKIYCQCQWYMMIVSVPLFGAISKIRESLMYIECFRSVSVPLFGAISKMHMVFCSLVIAEVSVPLFGAISKIDRVMKQATCVLKFPSPYLGLSLKSCPCKSACHKACTDYLRRRPYQQTTCPKTNLPHTLQIHSASGAAQFHSKSFIQ